MIKKPIELPKLEELTLHDAYIAAIEGDKKVIRHPFGADYVTTSAYEFRRRKVGEQIRHGSPSTLDGELEGINVSIPILDLAPSMTVGEIKEKNGPLYAFLMKHYNKDYLEGLKETKEAAQKESVARIDKQYKELIQLYSELGYKTDLENLTILDHLLYCEAEGFMMKMEERINKKSNPKNLRLYKRLMEIREQEAITCNDQ